MTPKQALFVQEYLVDLNGTKAAIRAGYSARAAAAQAARLLTKANVLQALTEAKAARNARTQITADEVVETLEEIAKADPRELTEYRRHCCRFCWGEGFRYQRTTGEFERARSTHALVHVLDDNPPPFDAQGGPGYHGKRDPNPDCPECFGDGVGEAFINDTRKLGKRAARLYAGVRITKDGLEVKTLSQDGAIALLAKHTGVSRDKLELTGPGGGPVQQVVMSPTEFEEIATRVLRQF